MPMSSMPTAPLKHCPTVQTASIPPCTSALRNTYTACGPEPEICICSPMVRRAIPSYIRYSIEERCKDREAETGNTGIVKPNRSMSSVLLRRNIPHSRVSFRAYIKNRSMYQSCRRHFLDWKKLTAKERENGEILRKMRFQAG